MARVVVDWDVDVPYVRLQVLVDVDRFPNLAGGLVRAWFGEGWRRLGGGMREHLLTYPGGASNGVDPEFPFGVEAYGTVNFRYGTTDDGDYWTFTYGEQEWKRLLNEVSAVPVGAFFNCTDRAGVGRHGKFDIGGSAAFYMTPNYLNIDLDRRRTPDRHLVALSVDARAETLYGTVWSRRTVQWRSSGRSWTVATSTMGT